MWRLWNILIFENNITIGWTAFLKKKKSFYIKQTYIGTYFSDFTRWLCHPRNKQKSPMGARGLRWQLPLCGALSPKDQVHKASSKTFHQYWYHMFWTMPNAGVVQQTPKSLHWQVLLFHCTSSHFQNYTFITVQMVSIMAIIAGWIEKNRGKDSIDTVNGWQRM